ncbi:xanthine dehydrogenase family protein molybdopterin-binding subunit [Litoreibacter roseus]|uniref:Aldehyde oxidase n=1 Tax=Litoreibacter roseus TaxID=2601869 RepID=A0A6N6JDI4_9RHOB|nr:xanthine dehydrogenase family protein molybdopterin-binding subunit [Litoreibacter roseus]GFE64205.1 aldehyde oxidase [Litoreibacter roseus]
MTQLTPTRRGFLTGAAGLVIATQLPLAARAQSAAATGSFTPNAFVRVGTDNTITVIIKHLEMGQGAYTGLASCVAEEMDADWSQVRAENAPADASLYTNAAFGLQGVGGSTGLASSYIQMRQAGAAARGMLVSAAARNWDVPESEITVEKGVVRHDASGNSASFGDLAEAATESAVPVEPPLKNEEEFTLIGQKVERLDSMAKSTGASDFTIDIYRDGMLTVAMRHSPKFGGKVASFNPEPALAIPGVERVEQISSGIAIYGQNTFAALKGREAVEIEWDDRGAETRSSEEMVRVWTEAARKPAAVAEESGDLDTALSEAATTLEAEYVFPFLAHAPLEPLDGVIELRDGEAEIWMGSQLQTVDHGVAAQTLGMDQGNIKLNTTLAGGSFGRRAQPGSEFMAQLAEVGKAAGNGAYKLLWTREDDIHGGYYRPLTVHRLRGGLDADGNIIAWDDTIANQSIIAGSPFEEALMQNGLDATAYEGSTRMPYAWPNHRVSWARMESPVSVLWWRSVGHTHTAYATETFLDELLEAGGKDPVAGRLELIKDAPRDRGVLERVADMAAWSGAGTGDKRYGVALHESFNSYVAMVAEVSNQGGMPHVSKIWCAVDCGYAVNPDVVIAQMEGGIGFGIGTAMFNEITLGEGGRVQQSNYDTYRMLRLNEMPEIEVSILNTGNEPTGVGEPGVPPVAPAIANAWRSLTGSTPRRQPFTVALS